jgi:hypothetical protein
MLRKLLFVGFQFIFKQRHFIFGKLVTHFSNLELVFLLQLGSLVVEVLFLSLNNYRKLRLFSLNYFDQFFKISDFPEILNLL